MMECNNKASGNNDEYESLHDPVMERDHWKTTRMIMPVIIIAMIIAVMTVFIYVQKINIINNAEQSTNQMAEYIAGNINKEVEYARSSIKFASSSISHIMTSDTLKNPSEIIAPMVDNSPFDEIEYIRADGMNVVNIGEPFDASDRIYYIEGIKGNTGIWNNYHPKTSQETLMNFYTPIYYRGEISGVLTGYIAATTQISPLFETKLFGEDIYGLLVDENDMVICSTVDTEYVQDLTVDLFLDYFGITEDQKHIVHNVIDNATEEAVSCKGPDGEGRICATTIPETEWKVVIIVPTSSLNKIVDKNTGYSVITIIMISAILVLYGGIVLVKNVKRHKEIAIENAKLEEENRIFNEENNRAFMEISAIRDINASANMGTWRMELVDGEEPRMYVDDTMKGLLGVSGKRRTPEETYKDWFDNIMPQAVSSVLESVDKMKQGKFDENTYLWLHPDKGERYVRCGGTAKKIEGGYLLSGYHYDVDDVVRDDLAKVAMLQKALNEKNDYYNTLGTLAGIYNSLHVIDLVEDTVVEFSAKDKVIDPADHKQSAEEMLARFMISLANDDCEEAALEYTNLKTLADRMQNKTFISAQFVSDHIGWFLASFITMETDAWGRPVRVVFTTQSIDEEKKQEEILIYKSRTDGLTGLLNRRAYEEDIYEQNAVSLKDDFVLMSLDVNGLKTVNDTLGHAAGDELLVGASQCMKKSFGPYGEIYRTGGDEFIAILFCDNEKLKEILADFEDTMAGWKGKLVDGLTVSYGFISKEEEPEMSAGELGIIADKRMYEAKSAFYRKAGVDRRGNQEVYKALCEWHTRIMKINLSDDTYQAISMDMTEQVPEKGASGKLSSWLSSFGTCGQVHPDDLQEYIEKTDMQFLRDYFAADKTSLAILFRRKYGEEFKYTMMEIIPANDYSKTNQILYLSLRRIEK